MVNGKGKGNCAGNQMMEILRKRNVSNNYSNNNVLSRKFKNNPKHRFHARYNSSIINNSNSGWNL